MLCSDDRKVDQIMMQASTSTVTAAATTITTTKPRRFALITRRSRDKVVKVGGNRSFNNVDRESDQYFSSTPSSLSSLARTSLRHLKTFSYTASGINTSIRQGPQPFLVVSMPWHSPDQVDLIDQPSDNSPSSRLIDKAHERGLLSSMQAMGQRRPSTASTSSLISL